MAPQQPIKALLLVLLMLFSWGGLVSGQQGLVKAPPAIDKKLGSYYLNTLGTFLEYYSILTQRNRITNAYLVINGLTSDVSPMEAANLMSPVRARYTKRTMGGKVSVDTYWKLFRCSPPCLELERIHIAFLDNQNSSTPQQNVLALVKGHIANTGWLIDSKQRSLNNLLAKPSVQEVHFLDPTYNTQLFYKLDKVPPPPCSILASQTFLGPIGQFDNATQFACISVRGTAMMMTTDRREGFEAMLKYATSANRCDGSLVLFYTDAVQLLGNTALQPRFVRRFSPAGANPYSIRWRFPAESSSCSSDDIYSTADLTVQAAAILGSLDIPYNLTLRSLDSYPIPTEVKALGFNTSCSISSTGPLFSVSGSGQTNDLAEAAANNQTFRDLSFIPYNETLDGPCISMLPVVKPEDGTSDRLEDFCAEALFRGSTFALREYLARIGNSSNTADSPAILALMANLTDDCRNSYSLDVANLLPEMAIDFENIKAFMLASTDVKIHLDSVAANAASVLAVEVALGSIGIVVSHSIARLRLYRSQRVGSNVARIGAVSATAVGITLFNIPNFVLISRSLENHNNPALYIQVGSNYYRPSNFSTVLFTETHSFVHVQSSRATAFLGLIFYAFTLLVATYVTWAEFTDIIRRKHEALSRLGHEAVQSDKHVLVEWRATDSLLHDTMHPHAIVEAGKAAEIQLLQRAAAGRQLSGGRAEVAYGHI